MAFLSSRHVADMPKYATSAPPILHLPPGTWHLAPDVLALDSEPLLEYNPPHIRY